MKIFHIEVQYQLKVFNLHNMLSIKMYRLIAVVIMCLLKMREFKFLIVKSLRFKIIPLLLLLYKIEMISLQGEIIILIEDLLVELLDIMPEIVDLLIKLIHLFPEIGSSLLILIQIQF